MCKDKKSTGPRKTKNQTQLIIHDFFLDIIDDFLGKSVNFQGWLKAIIALLVIMQVILQEWGKNNWRSFEYNQSIKNNIV